MEDPHRLAGATIDRHRTLYIALLEDCALHAECLHEGILLHRIDEVHLRMFGSPLRMQHILIQQVLDALLLVGGGDVVRHLLDHLIGIRHSHSQPGSLEHRDVVIGITDGDHLASLDPHLGHEEAECLPLVHIGTHRLDEDRTGEDRIQLTSKSLL